MSLHSASLRQMFHHTFILLLLENQNGQHRISFVENALRQISSIANFPATMETPTSVDKRTAPQPTSYRFDQTAHIYVRQSTYATKCPIVKPAPTKHTNNNKHSVATHTSATRYYTHTNSAVGPHNQCHRHHQRRFFIDSDSDCGHILLNRRRRHHCCAW